MVVPEVPYRAITYRRQVLQLYKNALRNIYSAFLRPGGTIKLRTEAVLLRERFEQNRYCTEEQGKKLLVQGLKELKDNLCYSQIKFAGSYGGLLHNRDSNVNDYVLDYWHPLEKAQYPEYFARREQRKEEFIKQWNKTYASDPAKKKA